MCICSVILGELEPLRNSKGLGINFPKILDEIRRITKVRHFLIHLFHIFTFHIFEFEILGFFFYEK